MPALCWLMVLSTLSICCCQLAVALLRQREGRRGAGHLLSAGAGPMGGRQGRKLCLLCMVSAGASSSRTDGMRSMHSRCARESEATHCRAGVASAAESSGAAPVVDAVLPGWKAFFAADRKEENRPLAGVAAAVLLLLPLPPEPPTAERKEDSRGLAGAAVALAGAGEAAGVVAAVRPERKDEKREVAGFTAPAVSAAPTALLLALRAAGSWAALEARLLAVLLAALARPLTALSACEKSCVPEESAADTELLAAARVLCAALAPERSEVMKPPAPVGSSALVAGAAAEALRVSAIEPSTTALKASVAAPVAAGVAVALSTGRPMAACSARGGGAGGGWGTLGAALMHGAPFNEPQKPQPTPAQPAP